MLNARKAQVAFTSHAMQFFILFEDCIKNEMRYACEAVSYSYVYLTRHKMLHSLLAFPTPAQYNEQKFYVLAL